MLFKRHYEVQEAAITWMFLLKVFLAFLFIIVAFIIT